MNHNGKGIYGRMRSGFGSDFWKDKRLALIMMSSFVWGIIAHGMALFNKYAYHDEVFWVNRLNYNDTYCMGRWGRAILGELLVRLFGSRLSSSSTLQGFIIIACLAMMLYIICFRLRIKNGIVLVALSGVWICFPAITGLFGFLYVSADYTFGSLLGVIGAYIFFLKKNVKTFIAASFLMMFSSALYQANIPIIITTLLLFMLDEVYTSDMKYKEYFVLALKNAALCAVFFAEYVILNSLLLKLVDMQPSSYKSLNNYGMTSITGYIMRIYTAYKRFVKPADYIGDQGVSANMFPWNLKYPHIILILVSVLLLFFVLRSIKTLEKKIQTGLILAISPMFAYFIYIMAGEPDVHGLMTFSEVMMFIIPAYFMERMKESGTSIKIVDNLIIILTLLIGFIMMRYDNVCYLKVDVMQTEAIGYYNRLISRIESTEGYTKETPVLYWGEDFKNDEDFSGDKLFDPIYLPPYNGRSIINDFSWRETMELWCGFTSVDPDEEAEANIDRDRISQMPCYPDDGSVEMIDDILVVKFAD